MRTWQSGHGSQLFTTVPVPGMLCIIVYPDHWNQYFECDVVILPVTEYINCLLIATVSDVPDIGFIQTEQNVLMYLAIQ